ncbi:MAG: flagellar biosynthetic protein FliQ [Kiloniellales bacterium]|nr:flagellar biosynthetic protein FliQ [Kiloniellales bacterium]
METSEVVYLGQIALDLMLKLSLPTLVSATVVGLLIAVAQAATQLQEQTLLFLGKLIAIALAFAATSTWFGAQLMGFLGRILDQFPALTR